MKINKPVATRPLMALKQKVQLGSIYQFSTWAPGYFNLATGLNTDGGTVTIWF